MPVASIARQLASILSRPLIIAARQAYFHRRAAQQAARRSADAPGPQVAEDLLDGDAVRQCLDADGRPMFDTDTPGALRRVALILGYDGYNPGNSKASKTYTTGTCASSSNASCVGRPVQSRSHPSLHSPSCSHARMSPAWTAHAQREHRVCLANAGTKRAIVRKGCPHGCAGHGSTTRACDKGSAH